ncbi:MAG: hypothetical protein ACYDB4_09265 [Candidatus Dormibacteraceae bacterium]
MLLTQAQDPPETATLELEELVTGAGEGCNPDGELLVEDEAEDGDEAPDEEDVSVDVLAVAPVDAPGMVCALIVANRPTPRRALRAAPVVRRLRRRMAASRARTLACVVSSVSIV